MTEAVHKLGEVLRTAREAKGVDLTRVERETKIRERYLSALERGEYRELPGSVYTKGFLRNYGAYLGLDPEYLIDLYRLETSSATVERPRMPSPPRPLATRRSRGFVVTPGAVVAAILTLMVGGFVAWLGYEFVNFARTPELRITEPAGNVSAHRELTITLRGATAPNARVTVSNLTENPTVVADASGAFAVTVTLLPGSNLVVLQARDPETDRDSAKEQRTIVVVNDVGGSPSPAAVAVALEQPAADATVSGPVSIRGTGAPNAEFQVSAVLLEAATPTFTVTDAAGTAVSIDPGDPSAPDPLAITADASGAFAGTLSLGAGTWDLSVTPSGGDAVTRRISVEPGEGLAGTLRLVDGDSYLVLEQDGEALDDVSDSIVPDGDIVELEADRTLRIRAGNAGAVRLTINGINIGTMGDDAQVVEWRITRAGG